ncbi:MAG: hypothetical protein AB7S26_18195 [Sandaracinaceae bacterium]
MSRSAQTLLLAASLLTAFSLFVIGACGGASTEEDPPPVCYESYPVEDGGFVRSPRAENWAQLAVRGYHEGQTSEQDCVGNRLEWHPTDRACDVHEDEHEPPPGAIPVSDESVIVGRSDSAMIRPVWVVTHHFEDGDGFGPVMLTEQTTEGVAVRAMGTLRMPLERARLRLRETAGRRVVVADGERCPDEDDQANGQDRTDEVEDGEQTEEPEPTCLRYARILPVVGDRLVSSEIRNSDGRCLSAAQVYLSREQTIGLENGWERTFRLAASMEYRAGAVIVHEQVTAEDKDPRDPGRPARLFRTTDADRVLFLERGGIRSRGLPLFERTVRAHGSTQLPIAESDRDRQ